MEQAEPPEQTAQESCMHCSKPLRPKAKFCHHCGKRNQQNTAQIDAFLGKRLQLIFGFYFSVLGFIVILHITEFQTNTATALISDCILALITLAFVIQNFSEIKPLFSFRNVKIGVLSLLLLAEALLALGVHFFAAFLNHALNLPELRYYYLYQDSAFPLFFTFLSIAVFPAIFEELGFRGVLFNHLSKITTRSSVIIVTGALFAIMHLSTISLFWLLPIGIVYGWLRGKYDTLWYGIIGHFAYNSFIVILEMVTDHYF